jgi:hypothetical protein
MIVAAKRVLVYGQCESTAREVPRPAELRRVFGMTSV